MLSKLRKMYAYMLLSPLSKINGTQLCGLASVVSALLHWPNPLLSCEHQDVFITTAASDVGYCDIPAVVLFVCCLFVF